MYYQQLALSQANQDKGPTGAAAPLYGPEAYLQMQTGPIGPRGPPGNYACFSNYFLLLLLIIHMTFFNAK